MSEAVTNQKERQKQFILSSNMWKVMFELSWPAVIAMVLYGLNSVIDGIFVGKFVGESALAGVSVAYPLSQISVGLGSQISVGLGSLIGVGAGSVLSIALGSKDKRTQERLIGNVNYLSIVSTLIYMVLGLFFSTQLVKIMGGVGESLVLGDSYFRITIFGSIFWIYGLAGNMIVRSEGKMKSAALMMGIGLVVNIIANYILIVNLGLGVEGAAWGTNIGMFVYTLLGWIYFGKGFSSFKTKVFSIYRDKDIISSIIRLGTSSLIMIIMNLVQAVIVFNALAKYGTVADIAFYGAVYRIFTFLLTPIFGLMRALQPVAGINYGSEQYERVISSFKTFIVASTILTLPFWIISMLSPNSILGLMLPDQIFSGTQLMCFRIYMAILPLLSTIFMAMTFFPAIDRGRPSAIIGIVRQLVFYVPVMIILPKMIGVLGIYYGTFGIDVVIVMGTIIMVKKEFNALRSKQAY
ncbi:Na+-driven multidrug efflux pump MatE [Gottschalkia acidurici 9a]|uniref:Multidrug export protein MepA n=1 Tax=Gottschalkia acidurici (strain ATCC 7906 / DSM 604 / BCRC 14475 / CIP 104303 / KCTC 5404 / NCIMB 10678 / 9a) TaxID=1128398 RepID=K0AXG4_GOTA9|nr:MATE family efflux transporter [Gottschalkia acidurici]AFS77457.1 Na+-driven multidrug efflux pump MatE [Gottschalkia acidurici 9a]